MKVSSLAAKVAALSSFVVLISAFVAYRAGVFDGLLGQTADTSANNAIGEVALSGNAAAVVDSPPPKPEAIMGSSKFMRVVEPRTVRSDSDSTAAQNALQQQESSRPVNAAPQNANKNANKNANQLNAAPDRDMIIPSSKSGPVFLPTPKDSNDKD